MKYQRITNRDTASVYKSDKFYNRLAEIENGIEDGTLKLIKVKPKERLLPCKCGYNRRRTWYIAGGLGMQYECIKCGYKSKQYNGATELRRGWNNEMRGE